MKAVSHHTCFQSLNKIQMAEWADSKRCGSSNHTDKGCKWLKASDGNTGAGWSVLTGFHRVSVCDSDDIIHYHSSLFFRNRWAPCQSNRRWWVSDSTDILWKPRRNCREYKLIRDPRAMFSCNLFNSLSYTYGRININKQLSGQTLTWSICKHASWAN